MSAQNAWHGQPVPYGGKPPPMPAGWSSNTVPNWNKGFWQANPYYNPNAAQNSAAQPWMPAQAWHQQPQQQPGANYNPYKRVVKPPSAEYMATALSDNPLGLTNMVPREELYGKEPEVGAAEHTPWLWNPTRLEEDDDQEAIITAVYRDHEGHRIGRESRGPAPTRARDSPLDTRLRDTSQPRHYSEPVVSPPQHHNNRNRFNSEPPPDTALNRRHSIDRPSSSSHPSGRSKSRDPNRPSSFQYGPSPPNSAPPTTSFPSMPTRASSMPPQQIIPREEFTSDIPLRPTFSTNIIRTPEHYTNSPRRSNSVSSTASTNTTPARPIQAHGSLDSMMSSRMSQLTMEEARRASQISSTVSGTDVFVDEPSSMLSPLLMTTPKPLSGRSLGRNHTAPASTLDVIPETSPIPPSLPPPHSASSSRLVSPMSSRHVSPISSAAEAHVSPPNSASSTRHMHRQSEYYSSASASASASANSTPTRPSPRRKRRKGFWNRRGDHLTSTGKIVYAPQKWAHPDELRGYPHEKEGYKDEFGIFIGYLSSREELEESLPRHGRAPARPYESFVVYED